jgi:hypothetical protein
MAIAFKKGDRVVFLGCSSYQIAWGNNDDPNPILNEGATYTISDVEVHSQHTKIQLEGIVGKFNSVCFLREHSL